MRSSRTTSSEKGAPLNSPAIASPRISSLKHLLPLSRQEFVHIGSYDAPADILTKSLWPWSFSHFTSCIWCQHRNPRRDPRHRRKHICHPPQPSAIRIVRRAARRKFTTRTPVPSSSSYVKYTEAASFINSMTEVPELLVCLTHHSSGCNEPPKQLYLCHF